MKPVKVALRGDTAYVLNADNSPSVTAFRIDFRDSLTMSADPAALPRRRMLDIVMIRAFRDRSPLASRSTERRSDRAAARRSRQQERAELPAIPDCCAR